MTPSKKVRRVKEPCIMQAWIHSAEFNACIAGMKKKNVDMASTYATVYFDKETPRFTAPKMRLVPCTIVFPLPKK